MVERLLDLKHPVAPASLPIPELVDQVLPRPLLTLEDWLRFEHRDLGQLPDLAVAVERDTLAHAMNADSAGAPAWLGERRDVLADVLQRRHVHLGELVGTRRV